MIERISLFLLVFHLDLAIDSVTVLKHELCILATAASETGLRDVSESSEL